MNYNDFDSCSDLYLGFDCDDVGRNILVANLAIWELLGNLESHR